MRVLCHFCTDISQWPITYRVIEKSSICLFYKVNLAILFLEKITQHVYLIKDSKSERVYLQSVAFPYIDTLFRIRPWSYDELS